MGASSTTHNLISVFVALATTTTMATHHPSPPAGMQIHHGPPGGPPQPGMAPQQQQQQQQWPAPQQMVAMNEAVWLQIGKNLGCEYTSGTNRFIRESR